MSWEGKSVLVTGSSGFIGSHLVDALLQRRARVIALDVASSKYHSTTANNIKILNFDIVSKLPSMEDKIDIIYHLAACAVPQECEKNPKKAFDVNVQGTHNILKFGECCNVKKCVFTSSALLYGREPQYIPIDEKHPVVAIDNTYSITKKLGEDLCNLYSATTDMSVTILRLFNAFGPRQDLDYLIPTIINQALKQGFIELWSDKPTRDFNYVQNTVDALLSVGISDLEGIFNVGSGEEINVGQMAAKIAARFGVELRFQNREVTGSLRLRCDNSKMKNTFGWEPRITFAEGLERTLDWYQGKKDK